MLTADQKTRNKSQFLSKKMQIKSNKNAAVKGTLVVL
jgi:hypothetical protein